MYKKTIFILCIFFCIWTNKNVSAQTTSDTFRYVSDTVQTWTVPGCVTQATIQLWSAGGGAGMYYCYYYYYYYWGGQTGGSGAYYQGVLSGLTAGTVFNLYVPSGGKYGNNGVCATGGFGGVGGWPGGGHGGDDNYFEEYGGGGGGYAAIETGGTYYAVTGGGGGAGCYPYFYYSIGGGGGATTGENGGSYFGPYDGGSGGTLLAGGTPYYNYYACDASPTEDGSALQGGYGGGHGSCYSYYYAGGGGGGGYYGGGGGGDDGGGGGGGSSFPTSSYSANSITFTVSYDTAGNRASYKDVFAPGPPPDTSIGMGGEQQNGGNGMIIITYTGGVPLLTSSISSQKNPSCGLCNGRLSVSASGGGGPYTYTWEPGGQTGDTATGLCAGSYMVIVSDSCGDADTSSALLVAIPISVSDSATVQDKCNGSCVGKIASNVSLGTSPYTYLWMPGSESFATATGLCAGTYSLTVTDKNGCTGTATAIITQPSAIVLSDTVTNVKCYSGIGTATVTATGGYSHYSYYWNPSGGTASAATGLTAGTYTATVTDSGGCTATTTATLTQPALLAAAINAHSNALCFGETGGSTATASGGVSPYTYLWNPGAQNTPTATGLIAGSYTVTISDSNDCMATASVTITQPNLLTANMGNPVNVLCYGGSGKATVAGAGGTIPYNYLWTPSAQTTATATGLTAGTYSVTITDLDGCTATSAVTITQPALLIAAISATNNVLCYGDTGNTTVTAGGGTLPYTYLWSPGHQTTALATGLSAGGYTVTVTDNNACTATAIVTITQPTKLSDTISAHNDILCYGGTGNATVMANGGTSPYTYLWNPTRQVTANATGLSVGTYSVAVNDHNGCSASAIVTITQPTLLTATMGTPNKIRCNGGTGSVTVNAAGGTLPYTYLWSPSAQTTAQATGLSAGSYSVTVTDYNHCSASATVNMTQPPAVTATILSDTNIGCNNGNNGTATVKGGGGIKPYTYLWSPSGNTNAHATGLFAVSYTVTVTDSNGCTATATTTLTQPAQLTVNVTEPRIICKDSTGSLDANVSGGTAPYKYSWSTGVTSTNNTVSITPVTTIYYSVTVTDVNGCTATGDITIHFGPSFAVNISGKNALCEGDSTVICANAVDPMYGATYLWTPQNSTNACFPVSPLSTSVYTVTVVDGCGAATTAITTVYIEPMPKVEMYADFYQGCKPLCVQFRNGTTIAQGSIQQYTWSFGNGDSSKQQSPVYCYKSGGEYNVTLTVVSDIGCSAALEKINMINVYDPPKAAFAFSPQPTTIENSTIRFTDESASKIGQGDVIYRLWKFGDESDSISNLANPVHTYNDTGTYCATLVVMNSGGCTDTITNCLVISPAFKLYIPSAFSPNSDERNETFQPVGQYVKNFEMYIFDRWGMPLYHTTDITKGWNGTLNGQSLQEDTYIYQITVTDSQGRQHSYVGNVTLLK